MGRRRGVPTGNSSPAVIGLLLVLMILVGASLPAEEPGTGIVVEEVGRASAAAQAGIAAGDRLVGWARAASPPANPEPARGDFVSPFDLRAVEIEQAPRGPMTLLVDRPSGRVALLLPPGKWQIKARPSLDGRDLEEYLAGRERVASGAREEGLGLWRRLAETARGQGRHPFASWCYLLIGEDRSRAREFPPALEAYDSALEEARAWGEPAAIAQALSAKSKCLLAQDDYAQAEAVGQQAVEVWQGQATESLGFAASICDLGAAVDKRRDLAKAREYYRRCLAIRERLAPDSLVIADALNPLGVVAWYAGDLNAAGDYFERSLALRERFVPGSQVVAETLNNLGAVHWQRGDLARAERTFTTALEFVRRTDASSDEESDLLNNLGLIAIDRGDLAAAEEHLLRSLRISEKEAPESLEVSPTYNNLGNVAYFRGDLASAVRYYRKSIAIQEKLVPDSTDIAFALCNLGLVLVEQGSLDDAEVLLRRAVALREKLAPDSLDLAISLDSLSVLLRARGDLAGAETMLQRALILETRLAPGGLYGALAHGTIGEIRLSLDDLEGAERNLREALQVLSKLTPGSSHEATALHTLGVICRRSRRQGEAAEFFRRAVEALETQRGRLGGTDEQKSVFGSKYMNFYRDYIDILVESKQPEAAFHVLERSRARGLLAMLAERDLLFTADVPEALASESGRIDREYDRIQQEIASANPLQDEEKIEQLLGRLRDLRRQGEELVAQVRAASPRLASLRYPEPFDLTTTQAALDPGTVLLAYSIGAESSVLFVVTKTGFSATPLPVGEEALRERVERFRRMIERGRLVPTLAPNLIEEGRGLYRDLIAPAEAAIQEGERVLLCPDGPLHALPFAALIREGSHAGASGAAGRPDFLIEWKPIHTVISATVYAELTKSRPAESASEGSLVAFGDPHYPALQKSVEDGAGDVEVRSVARRGFGFFPLPFTRVEVEKIAPLFPGHVTTYVGEEATEERAKSIGKGVRYVHFACHGVLDERLPLNSGLALSLPQRPAEGQDNGLLQAWEVFEKVRVDAELVTLSACETALGKEMGGEGLVGLTRAFQYAGARTILASLWSVSDRSTAELMRRFYGHLRAGASKAESLRRAQVELLEGADRPQESADEDAARDSSHPFHWAGFELIGDWH